MKENQMTVNKKTLKKKVLARWQLYLWLAIPIAYYLIFKYYPMFGIQLAFKKYDVGLGIWGSEWIGFENFSRFFKSYYFKRVITNTLRLSLYSVIIGFPIPIIFALMLNTVRNQRYKKFAQMVTFVPHFISVVVLVGMVFQIFNPRIGIYGLIYSAITGAATAPDILGKADAFPHIYIWSGIWQELGWNSVIYLAALAGVDSELHEAAKIDGASRFKRVLYIDLPSIVPTIVMLLILRCGSIMTVGFEKTYLLQSDLNLATSEVINTYSYKVAFNGALSDFGFSTAISLFNSMIELILLVTVNQISKKVSENSLW